MKNSTLFIILFINIFHFSVAQSDAEECIFIEDNAFEVFPVKFMKQQIQYNTDGKKFSITHFDAEGNKKKVVMLPGTPQETVISQKQLELNRRLFLEEIIEEKFNNNGDVTYKKINKLNTKEEIVRFEYNNRTLSKKIVEDFKLEGGVEIQISTTTYNYNLLNQLVSKRIEYTDYFIKNHTKIYPEYESLAGNPRNHLVTYDYVDNGLIKDVTVKDFNGLIIEKLNVYYSKIKIINFYLISEIIIQNKNNETISKRRYEYK